MKKQYAHVKNCDYCSITLDLSGEDLQTRREWDHVHPVVKDGKGTLENLAVSCHRCNQKKKIKHFNCVSKPGPKGLLQKELSLLQMDYFGC